MKINLENQFTEYLNRVKLNRHTMPRQQLIETRRAFYAGISQVYFLMTKDIANAPDEEVEPALSDIENQCLEFWQQQK